MEGLGPPGDIKAGVVAHMLGIHKIEHQAVGAQYSECPVGHKFAIMQQLCGDPRYVTLTAHTIILLCMRDLRKVCCLQGSQNTFSMDTKGWL